MKKYHQQNIVLLQMSLALFMSDEKKKYHQQTNISFSHIEIDTMKSSQQRNKPPGQQMPGPLSFKTEESRTRRGEKKRSGRAKKKSTE